jgi:hypothetical protein
MPAELSGIANHALLRFNHWVEQEIRIKNAGSVIGCLDSIRRNSWYATLGPPSRCRGRSHLRQDLKRLNDLFGNGCALVTETVPVGYGDLRQNDARITDGSPLPSPSVRLYTIGELAALHRLSPGTVTRLYENERGVQVFQGTREHQRRRGRRYRTLRVPRHVYLRVKNRMENK